MRYIGWVEEIGKRHQSLAIEPDNSYAFKRQGREEGWILTGNSLAKVIASLFSPGDISILEGPLINSNGIVVEDQQYLILSSGVGIPVEVEGRNLMQRMKELTARGFEDLRAFGELNLSVFRGEK